MGSTPLVGSTGELNATEEEEEEVVDEAEEEADEEAEGGTEEKREGGGGGGGGGGGDGRVLLCSTSLTFVLAHSPVFTSAVPRACCRPTTGEANDVGEARRPVAARRLTLTLTLALTPTLTLALTRTRHPLPPLPGSF